jgi:hypothetical protein
MKSTALFLFLALTSFTWVWGQADPSAFNIQYGSEGKRKNEEELNFIGKLSDGAVLYKRQKEKVSLERMNDRAILVRSRPLDNVKYRGMKKELDDGFVLNDKLYLKFTAYNKEKHLAFHFIDEYDPDKLTWIATKSLDTSKISGLKDSYWFGGQYTRALSEATEQGVSLSSDKNCVVQYSSSIEYEMASTENIRLQVFDNTLKSLWTQSVVLPYDSHSFQIVKVIVDENANAHLLAQEFFAEGDDRIHGQIKSKYYVVSFLENGKKCKVHHVELGNKWATDADIAISFEGDLIVSGLYTTQLIKSVEGVFSMKFPTDGEEIVNEIIPFNKEFLEAGVFNAPGLDVPYTEKMNMQHYDISQLVPMPDGGWILCAEQIYIVKKQTTNWGRGRSVKNYTNEAFVSEDVILIKMNPNGEMIWKQKIAKEQISQVSATALSFVSNMCNGSFYLVFNIENNDNTYTTRCGRVSDKGEFQEIPIEAINDKSITLLPAYSQSYGECQLLLYSAGGGQYELSLMQIVK